MFNQSMSLRARECWYLIASMIAGAVLVGAASGVAAWGLIAGVVCGLLGGVVGLILLRWRAHG